MRVLWPEWQSEPHRWNTLKCLIASSSPASLTCSHHLPNQPMKDHCVMLCFNQSLNLLLGFYRLSRLAYVFKPSMQTWEVTRPLIVIGNVSIWETKKLNQHLFRKLLQFAKDDGCKTYKVKHPSRNQRFIMSWYIDTKPSDMLKGNGCIDVRPGTSHR